MPTIGFVNRSMLDYDSEIGTARMNMSELTAGNFLAQSTKIATLQAAIQGVCLSALSSYKYGNRITSPTIDRATMAYIQRESKFLVQYRDTVTGSRHSVQIPCADLISHLDPGDHAHARIGDGGHVDAFITAFEAVALSPQGNAVDVLEITHVGRNL